MLEWLVDSLIRSIFMGSIYVLASLGLTLTLAVVKLPNFAHAEFLTIGGYVAELVSALFPNNFVMIGLAAFGSCAALAIVIHYTIFRPLINRKVSIYILVLASFAVAIFVRYSVFILASLANLLQTHPQETISVIGSVESTNVTNIQVLAIVLAPILTGAVGLFLTVTQTGKSMRAVASNFDLARISGINLSRVINVMWVLAGGLAGLGGVFLGIYTIVTPIMGFQVLLDIFAVVIIAGLTSMGGTVLGGYIVGLSENLVMDVLHNFFDVSLTYKPMLPFALIIVVLLFKPTGLTPNTMSGFDYIMKFIRRSAEARRGNVGN